MKLVVQVGLGPGHIVLDGDPDPLKKGTQPTIFGPCLLWPTGWMHEVSTRYRDRPRRRRYCVTWGLASSSPPKKRGRHSLNIRPMSIVAKRRPSQLLLRSCVSLSQ